MLGGKLSNLPEEKGMKIAIAIIALIGTLTSTGAQTSADQPARSSYADSPYSGAPSNKNTVETTITTVRPPTGEHINEGIVRRKTDGDMLGSNERHTKWLAYCKPELSAPNANGVRHYIYAKPGCEHGRTED